MELLNYITENALLLIPALVIVGMIIKQIEVIPNKFIPLLLLVVGVAGTLTLLGVTVDSIVQGVLVTGAAVYGNQIVKQL
ncbi:MAG TPA: holin, partial [Ruminococcaceae bacterium]|nr:holin [Oscillospiraceae bacterium]